MRKAIPHTFNIKRTESSPQDWSRFVLWIKEEYEDSIDEESDYIGLDENSAFEDSTPGENLIDINYFIDLLDDKPVTLTQLPKSFGVECNINNPRWNEYIEYIRKNHNYDYSCDSDWEYFGVDVYGRADRWDTDSYFEYILSVDEFFELVEGPREITNYSIY